MKCRFNYSRVVRPIDQEMTATEMTVCYSQFPMGGDMPHTVGVTQGSTKVRREVEGAREKCGQEPLLFSPGENGQGFELSGLGLAIWNNFRGSQSTEAVLSYLVRVLD